jgi:hypothetical protein
MMEKLLFYPKDGALGKNKRTKERKREKEEKKR